ncbi:MAG: nucleotidyltransferase family protein [Alphaproteobacteria bacterium]
MDGAAAEFERRFQSAILANPYNCEILSRLPRLGLPDAWLVSGCLFQTVWNVLDRNPPTHGIKDYDIFYFDPDTSWEAEDAKIKAAATRFADLKVEVEVRNQARVHLWYEQKFGVPCPQFHRACDGIDHFLNTFSMVGVSPEADGLKLYAPVGLEDVFARVMRPNPLWRGNSRRERYDEKAARWKSVWPSLTVLPWSEQAA